MRTMLKKQTHSIEIDDLSVRIIRKPIKNIYIRIEPPDGQVSISAPLGANLDLLHQQLALRKEWIKIRQEKFQAQPQDSSPIISGSSIPFLGKDYKLLITREKKRCIQLNDEVLNLHALSTDTTEQLSNQLNGWYKQQMQQLLPTLVTKWEKLLKVQVRAIRIQLMKSRWGSCNTYSKNISLNLKLVKKPIECLEYVLLHEMVHLLEKSHNQRFYSFMDHWMPDWRLHRNILEPHRKK